MITNINTPAQVYTCAGCKYFGVCFATKRKSKTKCFVELD